MGVARNRNISVARGRRKPRIPDNAALAELLAIEAEKEKEYVAKAYRRASILAYSWREEAASIFSEGRSLTELPGIGPFLKTKLETWLQDPPVIPAVSPLRDHYYTWPRAQQIINELGPLPIKGDLQMHSRWSDGSASIKEMAKAAMSLGHQYIGITDHTKGLKIAGGIDEAALARQRQEIEDINAELNGFRVLASAEVNLSPQGEMDLDKEFLKGMDIVLGSFHSALRKKEDQTARYLAAIRNPALQILGHPKGRVYNYRAGLEADWEAVFSEAAKLDKAVEVDSYIDRQDLPLPLLKIAKKAGTRISIGTDAHNPAQLTAIHYGIAAVLEAGIPSERILNCLGVDELLGWVRKVRNKSA